MAIMTSTAGYDVPHSGTGFFRSIGRALEVYMDRRSRREEVERLHAMSDEDLGKLGIKRDHIAQYVFRDVFWA